MTGATSPRIAWMFGAALTVILARPVAAQTPWAGPVQNQVVAGVGWDSTWLAETGYARALPVRLGNAGSAAEVRLALPVVLVPGLSGGTAESGLTTLFRHPSHLGASAAVDTGLSWATDSLGDKVAWVGQVSVRPGYYADRFSVAADLTWRTSLATHISHSDAVHDLFDDRYPDGTEPADTVDGPRSGWYALAANRLRLGLAAATRVGRAASLYAVGGWELTPQAQGIHNLPPIHSLQFTFRLGGGWRW